MIRYKKPILILLAVALIAGLWLWRVLSFNQRINSVYSTPVVYYDVGQDIPYNGSVMSYAYTYEDCSIRVDKVQWLTLGQLYESILPGHDPYYGGAAGEESPVVLLELAMTNSSEADQYFEATDMALCFEADPTMGAYQVWDVDPRVNEKLRILLPKGETVSFTTAFVPMWDMEDDPGPVYLEVTSFPVSSRVMLQ